MKNLVIQLTELVQSKFESLGYDKEYGKVEISNRPDLCQYQCNDNTYYISFHFSSFLLLILYCFSYYSSCNASAGCILIACRAGNHIPITTIRAISNQAPREPARKRITLHSIGQVDMREVRPIVNSAIPTL